MVFFSILSIAFVLPSVMGLTLNTPANAVAGGSLAVTWQTQAGDPKFSLILQGPTESIDLAQGIDPTTLNDTIALGSTPPGSGYVLNAVVADDIETSLSKSGAFNINAAGAAGAGNAAGTGAAATGAAATSAAATATGNTGKGKGKGAAAAAAAAAKAKGAAAAQAAKAKGAAAAQAAKAKGQAAAAKAKAGKNGRSVASVKFGRRELYRD